MAECNDVLSLGCINLHVRNGFAILEIDNPPVNAGSHAVRKGIVDSLDAAIERGVDGAVILGAGRCFVAGSDLREFGQKLAPPDLPGVIRAIEEAPFPVVAAIHGVALGGGLELALGCDYRIADSGASLGLPEVSLGILPGAGGTQRLPRLVGCSKAISMICHASPVQASEALEIGLVDAICTDDLLTEALAFLSVQSRPKRLAISLAVPAEDTSVIDAAAELAIKRGKGRPNIVDAIRLVKKSTDHKGREALVDEREVFQRLRMSDDAFALRYLFFAERRAGTVDELDTTLAASVRSAAVIGGGTMGQGIVKSLLSANISVTLLERDSDSLERALLAVQDSLRASVNKGRLAADECHRRLDALSGSVDYGDIAQADLAIEAVFEDMEVKKQVLATLEATLAAGAVIATNTSYLNIDQMAEGLRHPERVVGLHYFGPADVMPLLEIVRTESTSDAVLATAIKLARKQKKNPVIARVAEGFIGNRIYAAYRRRAELLVLEGASPEQVDTAIRDFGFAMGPFAVSDLSGLDIAWAMRKRHASTRDPLDKYVTIADLLCESGRLGRKVGKGWYNYSQGKAQNSAEVDALIARARQEAGVMPKSINASTIQHQLMAAIINEAACLLQEEVAQRASDIDVTLCNGYGFPRWRGGPLYWAVQQDVSSLQADLDELGLAVGHGHKPGPVAAVLAKLEVQS